MNSLFSVSNNNANNNFFSSMLGASSGSASSILSDWSMIKNGTYYKLAKAYYGKNGAVSDSQSTGIKSQDKTVSKTENKAEKTALTTAKGNADALKKAADTLMATGKNAVFNKKTVTNAETGKTTEQYDTDGIYKAVKNFVDSYNDVVKNTIDSDTVSVLRKTMNMVGATKTNANLLEKMGIKIKEDNTLTIDEETFKKTDMVITKSLFNGSFSFADRIGQYAEDINTLASNALRSMDKGTTYRASGAYASNASSVGSMYDSNF